MSARSHFDWVASNNDMNHAVAFGYLVANVYRLLEKEMDAFCNGKEKDEQA